MLEDVIGREEVSGDSWEGGAYERDCCVPMEGDEKHPGKREGPAVALLEEVIARELVTGNAWKRELKKATTIRQRGW